MSTAVQIRIIEQTEKEFPRKKRCAFEGRRGVHYFIAMQRGDCFCSKECRKADERDRPT